MMRVLILDTEANGKKSQQICQLALLTSENGATTGENHFYTVDEMEPSAQAIHGLDPETLAVLSGGLRFEDDAPAVYAQLAQADLVIGHNLSSDLRLIAKAFQQVGLSMPDFRRLCTMRALTQTLAIPHPHNRRKAKPPKLTELCAFYALSEETISAAAAAWFGGGLSAHDARFDAAATWLCVCAAAKAGHLPA